MNIEVINTFLKVVDYGSISMTARKTFATQSAISKKILQLEEELGVPLLLRQKGQRTVELTPYGHEFLPKARQWIALYQDFKNIKHITTRKHLDVAGTPLANSMALAPFYQQYMKDHSDICLFIKTIHSTKVYQQIHDQLLDIGYVFVPMDYEDIVVTPIYQEQMHLICHQDSIYHDQIHPSELIPEEEVYINWDTNFELWHNHYFDKNIYKVKINSLSPFVNYFNTPENWAIVPTSAVHSLCSIHPLKSYSLSVSPPNRICYQVESIYPKHDRTEVVRQFKKELNSFIHSSKNSTIFQPLTDEDGNISEQSFT